MTSVGCVNQRMQWTGKRLFLLLLLGRCSTAAVTFSFHILRRPPTIQIHLIHRPQPRRQSSPPRLHLCRPPRLPAPPLPGIRKLRSSMHLLLIQLGNPHGPIQLNPLSGPIYFHLLPPIPNPPGRGRGRPTPLQLRRPPKPHRSPPRRPPIPPIPTHIPPLKHPVHRRPHPTTTTPLSNMLQLVLLVPALPRPPPHVHMQHEPGGEADGRGEAQHAAYDGACRCGGGGGGVGARGGEGWVGVGEGGGGEEGLEGGGREVGGWGVAAVVFGVSCCAWLDGGGEGAYLVL